MGSGNFPVIYTVNKINDERIINRVIFNPAVALLLFSYSVIDHWFMLLITGARSSAVIRCRV